MMVKLKSISIGIICLLILCGFIYIPIIKNNPVTANTLYVGGTGGGNYSAIQTAINAANVGDTVYVYAGTYIENININKKITLVGASQINTTIDGGGTGHVIQINANGVNINGFKIINSGTANWNAGIAIIFVLNCLIMNNNVSSNGFCGFSIQGAGDNTIRNNTVTYNQGSGIIMTNTSTNNKIINNVINNNCLNKGSNEAGLKIYDNSGNNNIIGNEINNNNLTGVLFSSADSNLMKLNSISGNQNGIYFQAFDNNNIFYFNEFVNNTKHVNGTFSSRSWNSPVKITYLYNNTNFTNYLGNYWDNYAGMDTNGDGIGETPYNVETDNDLYPLMKLPKYYTIIPSSTNVDLVSIYSNSTNETVSIVTHTATLSASISGDFTGSINFTGLQLAIINSSFFVNKGFFISNWISTIEGKQYQGNWQGMLFNKSGIRKYYLKGTLFGDFQGITDGDLAESTYGSGIYDIFNSTSTLNYFDSDITYSQIILNGTVGYQKSTNTSSEIYILQSLFNGNATGYYNKSLSVVLTHVRINNVSHPWHGKGFSIISYTSAWGSGSGWTYDRSISSTTMNLTGFFTEPLWGIIFGELVEIGGSKTLSIKIIRLDLGAPPSAIVQVEVSGPWTASPGDTINYLIEYRNIGLKPVYNVEIVFMLSNYTQYISNTGNGSYNATYHQVTWNVNISAKSKGLLSVTCQVNWGLSWGTKLIFNCYIIDWSNETVLAVDTWTTIILPANDPNAKYGPEGSVLPGQKLAYSIEFENVGLGNAYGVYFTDTLDEHLDDLTLEIGPVFNKKDNSIIGLPGIYDRWTKTITWFVGELGPGEGGYANFSIDIHSDAIFGTVIINYGIVYFPSVPEITKTNGIVSIIQWNIDPIANAGTDLVVMTLEEITFDGSGSTDPDGEIIKYNWDFGDCEYAHGKIVSHTYQDDGNYKVKLNVTDNNCGTNEHEITVRVLNRVPLANLEADRTEIYTNEQVNFNALNSTDTDGVLVEYNFDFGDGSSSGWLQSTTASHIYTDGPNVYTAKLNVKDDDGNISVNVAELEITVKNRIPIAQLTSSQPEAFTYENILFDAGLSSDPDGSITGYHFDFGDNTNSGWVTTSSVLHQFMDGTKEYTIQLVVKDEDGDTESAELIVKIKNRDPVASAGSDKVTDTNQIVNFSGELSSDIDGIVKSYIWDFGDGETGAGKTVNHVYTDNGEYIVTLTVADDDGAKALDACKVTVNNVRPIATFIVTPSSGDINTEFIFSSTSFDTDGFITSFYWDFGDGTTSDQAETTHQYTTSGIYNVSLIVTDDDGMESDISKKEITLLKEEKTDHEDNSILTSAIILIITTLIIILLIIPLVIRKRKQRGLMLGEPFTQDETLQKVSQEVLTDPEGQNLSISRGGIKNMLESSREKGELSEEAYDYITENVLYPEEEE